MVDVTGVIVTTTERCTGGVAGASPVQPVIKLAVSSSQKNNRIVDCFGKRIIGIWPFIVCNAGELPVPKILLCGLDGENSRKKIAHDIFFY